MECHRYSQADRQFVGPVLWCILGKFAILALILLGESNRSSAQSATNCFPTEITSNSVPVASLVPSFHVERYAITGNTTLSQETIDWVMRDAIGTNITIPQIRRALQRLQDTYRERGYTKAAVTLPRQSLLDGKVKVRVEEGPNAAANQPIVATSPAAPKYVLKHFEVYGNTALDPGELDKILSPVADTSVNEEQIRKTLAQLQDAYRQRGYPDVSVSLPEQVLTDGTLIIHINEGSSSTELASTAITNASPQTAATPARTFEILHYEVAGNTLLPLKTLEDILVPATGTNITVEQIQKAKLDLLMAYRERGFASVSVLTPPQQITNATIRIEVTEGRLADVRVTGNHYFSSNNVMRSLPTLKEAQVWKDEVVNSRVLQRELDLANRNPDRTIYPVISPGPDPGTSAIELRVKDRLPLHGRMDVNNYSTPGTPDWRINTSASYNNLWQLEHQIGISYGFTPEAFKSQGLVDDYFFNRPLISYYGGYYRLPFGNAESVSDRINSSAQFGYDEATHRFRLPPAGARPDLTVFASSSSSDTGVKYSSLTDVTPSGSNPFITSQDSGQNLTINHDVGARLNIPWVLSDTKHLSFSGGFDWKEYQLESFNTNNFTFIYQFHDPVLGDQTIVSESHSAQPARHDRINYLPLSVGIDFSETDKQGSTALNFNGSYNFVGDWRVSYSDFPAGANPTNYPTRTSGMSYWKLNASATRDQKVFNNWSLLLRANGQAATKALISNEQFALGGVNSVRGYFEGDEYGDAGWFGSIELRTPFVAARVPGWSDYWPVWLRGSAFADGGQRFLLDAPTGIPATRFLLGAGFGLSANINNHVDLRLTVGWPLRDSANTSAGDPHAYFSLGGQF